MNKLVFKNIGETLYYAKLENGLRVYVAPKPGFSKSFAMFSTEYGGSDRRYRLAGSWHDTPAGVAHFLEHKLFDMPDGKNALSVLSQNGASPNAFTSNGMTAYHFECTESFDENLKCLLDFVSTPYFTKESVAKEQGIIAQEIRMMDDSPGFCVYMDMMGALYEHNPVRDDIAGTVESIGEITPEILYSCHKAFYAPENMTLCASGPISPERVEEIAASLPAGEREGLPERDYGPFEGLSPRKQRTHRKMEVAAPLFLFGSKVKPEKSGEAFIRQQTAGELSMELLTGRSSPLYARLYAAGLINQDFGAEFEYFPGGAFLGAGGESKDPEAVAEELRLEMRRLADGGTDNALFERLRKAEYGRCLRELNSVESICHDQSESAFRGFDGFDRFRVLEEIGLADIQAFMSENFLPEHAALSTVSPDQR